MGGPSPFETPENSSPGISLSLNPSEEYESSSTLQYVNSQLVAHGFARAPGLSIDGISKEDGQKLVKCIMSMLSQRMEDVGQMEQLGSKLRTLTYEFERLQSINRTAQDNVGNAQREMTQYKSKLTASQRAHTAEIAAHKQTTAELQRTRTALQYLRTTTQNELKRKEKEIERISERWVKISDAQAKLAGVSAGLQCANYAAACEQPMGKGIMEEALEQAEEARVELVKENEGFRSVLLGTANALQAMTCSIRTRGQDIHVPDSSHQPQLTPTAVFAPPTSCLTHPENAHIKIKELFTNLKEAVANTQQDISSTTKAVVTDGEVEKMQQTINTLRSELDAARNASNSNRTEAQEAFDHYAKYTTALAKREHPPLEITNVSTDSLTIIERDALREALDERTKELEIERKKFTDATIKLGHERSELEVERRHFFEEKRRWEVDRMLAELPPTPPTEDPDLLPSPKRDFKDRQVSPRRQGIAKTLTKSPKRSSVTLKSPTKKKSRVTFKQDEAGTSHRMKTRRESKLFEKVEVLYEPENEQSPSALSGTINPVKTTGVVSKGAPPVLESQIRRKLAEDSRPSMPLVLPTSFTLPPPSPASSFSLQPLIDLTVPVLSSSGEQVPFSIPNPPTAIPPSSTSTSATTSSRSLYSGPSSSTLPPSSSTSTLSSTSVPSVLAPASSSTSFDNIPLVPSSSVIPSMPSRPIRAFPSPRTPRVLLNVGLNGAKKHDYSPAKPSPLSRILMIADSPLSPDDIIGTIQEEKEEELKIETTGSNIAGKVGADALDISDEASPLRVKLEANNLNAGLAKKSIPKDEKAKSKARAVTMEKENVGVPSKKMKSATTEAAIKVKTKTTSGSTVSKTKSTATARTEASSQGQTIKPGGARRIPLGAPNAGKVSGRLL